MIEKKAIYRCQHCGNIIESLWDGKPDISCCGEPMTKLEENTQDAAKEKHVPVIKKDGNKVTVTVGEVEHPMTDDHYILFVELIVGEKVYRKDFKAAGEKPQAVFMIDEDGPMRAREFCNKHGLHAAQV